MTRRMLLAAALCLTSAMGASAAEPTAPDSHLKEGALRKAFLASDMSGSKAPRDLRQDVADELFDMERAARPSCTPELMSIKIINEQAMGRWMERWFVRSCFERFPYRVTYFPSKEPGKATEFKIVPDIGKHGYPVN